MCVAMTDWAGSSTSTNLWHDGSRRVFGPYGVSFHPVATIGPSEPSCSGRVTRPASIS